MLLRRNYLLDKIGDLINPARREDVETLNTTITDGSQKTQLTDPNGTQLIFYTDRLGRAFINVHDGHVHDRMYNHLAVYEPGTSTTLTAPAAKNTYELTVASTTGIIVGSYIDINVGTDHKHQHRKVTGIDGLVLTIDSRLDLDHPTGSLVQVAIFNLAESAATATKANPVIFYAMANPGEVLHITRLLISMTHSGVPDGGKFGGIAALTEGLQVRVNRGNGQEYETLTNWKKNQDLQEDMFDVSYTDAAPSGLNGTAGRFTFLNSNTIIRLDGDNGDIVELLIQDPEIADLDDFQIKFQAHYEEG